MSDLFPPRWSVGGQPPNVEDLSTDRLRSIVRDARTQHGPRRLRWSTRQQRAWHELNKRGAAV